MIMAKITVEGLEEYANRIASLYKDTESIARKAVYAGADVVADAIKEGLKNIPVEEGKNGLPPMGTVENKLNGISRRQKADLIDSFGLAPMENKGDYIQTKAGFDGYGSIKTKKYPKGTPNTVLMRSIESGSSFREKHPVVKPAVNGSRKAAVDAMGKSIDESCKEIMDK